jgi:diadenosine tetraphosphate (Ap4A) HIT family hydrolase
MRDNQAMFTIHNKLQADTIEILSLALSRVLLMNDSSFPWLILVPAREDISEIYELGQGDRSVLIEEVALASGILRDLYMPDKINLGALGNLVPQLHIHLIGRFMTDRAWPGPVWGAGTARPYQEKELSAVAGRIKEAFQKRDRVNGR